MLQKKPRMTGYLWMMNCEGCGRKRSWSILYPALSWNDWGNYGELVRIAGFEGKNQTTDLRSRSKSAYHYTVMLGGLTLVWLRKCSQHLEISNSSNALTFLYNLDAPDPDKVVNLSIQGLAPVKNFTTLVFSLQVHKCPKERRLPIAVRTAEYVLQIFKGVLQLVYNTNISITAAKPTFNGIPRNVNIFRFIQVHV
jgi:hypothetical protein